MTLENEGGRVALVGSELTGEDWLLRVHLPTVRRSSIIAAGDFASHQGGLDGWTCKGR